MPSTGDGLDFDGFRRLPQFAASPWGVNDRSRSGGGRGARLERDASGVAGDPSVVEVHAARLLREQLAMIFRERALVAIERALNLLAFSPFSCRKALLQKNPRRRELLIPFGHSGYVALFEIEDDHTVTVTAIRHQREEDYH